MTATFTLTPADFVRLQKVVARRFRQKVGAFSWQFLMRVLVWLCIGLAGATYARVMREFPEGLPPARTSCVPSSSRLGRHHCDAVRIAGVYAQAHARSQRSVPFAPNHYALARVHQRRFSAGNTVLPWSGVLARDEDETHYYLFIDAMQALVLPRTAIAPAAAEFEQYTRHLKSAA